MGYILTILTAYLLGCSNMACYIARWKKIDLRAGGSGNLGASNAAIMIGWRAGILTGLHDIGKAALAVALAGLLFPNLPYIRAIAGVCCVLGHIFPVFMKFRGGKGFAPYLGMTLALNWKLALVVAAAVVLITLISDYIVCGTFTAVTVVPVWEGIAAKDWMVALILLVATGVIIFRHWENISRIRAGKEIGLRSTLRKEHRAEETKV